MLDVAASTAIHDGRIVVDADDGAIAMQTIVDLHAVAVDGANLSVGTNAGSAAAAERYGAAGRGHRTRAGGIAAIGHGSAVAAWVAIAIAVAADVAAIAIRRTVHIPARAISGITLRSIALRTVAYITFLARPVLSR